MKNIFLILIGAILFLPARSQTAQDFIHASGQDLVHYSNNTKINLRGINFNDFWLQDTNTINPNPNWFFDDPNDIGSPQYYAFGNQNWYSDAQQIGFNCVRLATNYRYFEDNTTPFVYKQSGWNFIDQNITWANQYNMYLILDIHIPQGGIQNSYTNGTSSNLWTNSINQDRLVALWYNIAQRYVNDTTIAAYDLLNEPTPVDTTLNWKNLAQRIIDTIRTVDNNHLIIVEYAYGVIYSNNSPKPFWDLSKQMFMVNDNNVMYDFHYYDPLAYTLQCYNNPGCTPTIQYNNPSQFFYTEGGQNLPFNQTWLATDLAEMMTVYQSYNVPINIGEWAPWRANYEYNSNQMQGYDYICDLVNLLDQNNLNWQYYCYEEYRPVSAQSPQGNNGLNERLRNYLLYNQCVPGNTVDVADNLNLDAMKVYPNPVKKGEQISIIYDGAKSYSIIISDLLGKTIKKIVLKNTTSINTNQLNKGIYFIQLVDENRKILSSKKIVVD